MHVGPFWGPFFVHFGLHYGFVLVPFWSPFMGRFWCLSGGLWGRFRVHFWSPFRPKTVQKQIQEATPEEVGPGEAILAETVQKRCPHHFKIVKFPLFFIVFF